MRRTNLSLALRHLRTNGGRSRAQLAQDLGVSKATASALVGELGQRGLVRESELHRTGGAGRPGLTVDPDGRHVAGVGLELNTDYLAAVAVDLRGRRLAETVRHLDIADLRPAAALDAAADLVGPLLKELRADGVTPMGLALSTSGVIDHAAGVVTFAANLGWRDVPVVSEVRRRLGLADDIWVSVESANQLAAVAEHAAYGDPALTELLYVSGDEGVGAGIIAHGRIITGASGFSGEVGHLPLNPAGTTCRCGRTGCWETLVGFGAVVERATSPGDPLRDHSVPLPRRIDELRSRLAAADEDAHAAIEQLVVDLTTGLSVGIDLLNPQVVVLGGWFAAVGDLIATPVARALEQRQRDFGSVVDLAVSRLGALSSATGGAHFALEPVLDDPLLAPKAST
ncbi:putative NBD/HSP70 family sugar kinase [Knoellia remsis]|uniref:Putative NBD/HSP70 family sugar kinase n=2 Tax=Knoellia remsis TaxID=407159 RepID=A0A2T0UEJ9_9MICO|nr:putative NBD/HSP70 family sugar kinase [Knoellia remsis]